MPINNNNKVTSGEDKGFATKTGRKSNHRLSGAKRFRFSCSNQIVVIKHQLVLDAFQVIFRQFPLKITELATLKSQPQYQQWTEGIVVTPSDAFLMPPSLRDIQNEQCKQQQSTVVCNYNRKSQIFLSYDGYIKSHSQLMQFVGKLESYYDFYNQWWNHFYYAVLLMKPQIQDENNLDSEVQDSTVAFLNDISDKISGFVETVDICKERLENIVNIQQNPHITDYRLNLMVFERETWFDLCLALQSLHTYFVLTYDCVAKNYYKLI